MHYSIKSTHLLIIMYSEMQFFPSLHALLHLRFADHVEQGPEAEIYELSSCQEFRQLADLASDWFFILVQPIRSQLAC